MHSQLILNGLNVWSIYVIVGIGFGLIYWAARFFHFAHGAVITTAGYFAFACREYIGLSIWLAASIAIILCTGVGIAMLLWIYSPLIRKKASPLVLLLASLGIYIFIQNLIAMFFGDETKSLSYGMIHEGSRIVGARITSVQIFAFISSLILLFILEVVLKRTKLGTTIRAVSNDRELATISGLNDRIVMVWTFGIGSAVAGIVGVLIAVDTGITPSMGMTPLLMGVVSVIIGGKGRIAGIAVGASILAAGQQTISWYLGSQWTDVIAFLILCVFLVLRQPGLWQTRRQ